MRALACAWSHGSCRLLVIGFFVCGVHLAFAQRRRFQPVPAWPRAVTGLY
jgi:hypothetical protein